MAVTTNTLLIEGSFEELADELAQYIDGLKKSGDSEEQIQPGIQKLLEDGKKEEALKKLVTSSIALNSAPEKGISHISRNLGHLCDTD
jgi:translation initiation factor 3 subunit M